MVGQKFGLLVVLGEINKLKISGIERTYFQCKCDCGNLHNVRKDHLLKNKITSCGCKRKQSRPDRPAYNAKPVGMAAAKNVFNRYKANAKKRSLDFTINFEQFIDEVIKPCIYCGREKTSQQGEYFVKGVRAGAKKVNGTFKYTGLDRVDNKQGYTLKNIAPCCGQCNIAKSTYDQDQFKAWIELVYKNFVTKE